MRCAALPADRVRLSHLLGKLARSAHDRHSAEGHRRSGSEVTPGRIQWRRRILRHEHEWRVWQDVKLPDGKILIPGVVSHATNIVEHPEVVADRIVRYARWWGVKTSSPGPIAGLAAASIRRSPGRSSKCWPKARSLRARSFGASGPMSPLISRKSQPGGWRSPWPWLQATSSG